MTEPSTTREGAADDHGSVSAADLDRERIRSYVAWGEVDAPWWYWPVYAAVIAVWIAAYGQGLWWGAGASLLAAATLGAMLGVITSRTGVSTPRFRGMPGPLRRTFLPIVLAVVAALVTVGAVVALVDQPPFALLGVVVGATLAFAGWLNARWYRVEARELARAMDLSW